MKKFLRTAMAIACLLSLFMPMQAQDRAGATEEEYGNIVVYLETAKWGQDSPYNKLCFTSNGSQAITGCVPTAYAILMNYHKWPAKANEGYKFTEWTKGTDVVSKEPIFTTVAREAMVITANFEKSASTNIVAVAEDKKEQHIYDLSGRRVEKITIPGVYVVNGMTVVIKK